MLRIAGVTICLMLISCASVQDISYRPPPKNIDGNNPPIYTIEINDAGHFQDPRQLSEFTSVIQGNNKDVQIIAFIHGWHHNANIDDENYLEFKKFAMQFQNKTPKRVLALYIGWRGDSISSFFDFISDVISDFWTIKDRKRASITVGEGSVRNIIGQIKTSIVQNNNTATIIGHSLGASVLFNAIKNDLIADDELKSNLTYVLLNPAIDKREYALADTSHFSDVQRKPLLITIQSNKDFPVSMAFRIAYFSTAVGFSSDFITYDMWACDPLDFNCMKKLNEEWAKNQDCVVLFNQSTWFIDARKSNGPRAPTCDMARRRVDWVIDARNTVSASHNNILTDAEVTALIELTHAAINNNNQ